MKVFLSSLINGMEEYRAAARRAAETLRHRVIAAEDFGASPLTPQQVCLQGVRDSDLVLLLLGERYGAVQQSGLSATQEEYREARGNKPVLAFVQQDVAREPRQEQFVDEVSTWEGGGYRISFDTPQSLESAVTRALHDWELAQQAGSVDEEELLTRATALLPEDAAQSQMGSRPVLHLVVAGAPAQQVLRPRDLDESLLQRDIAREAVYGDHSVLDGRLGVQGPIIRGATLVLRQENAEVAVDERGNIRVSCPARNDDDRRLGGFGVPSLIEEDVRKRVADNIVYAGWVLDRIDPTHRLSRVAVACRLDGAEYLPWRTRAEATASPGAAEMGSGTPAAFAPPTVMPRPALLFDAPALADDITVRLRRQITSEGNW